MARPTAVPENFLPDVLVFTAFAFFSFCTLFLGESDDMKL